MTLRRLLWPTDFTELAARAGTFARVLAEWSGATLYVLHAAQSAVAVGPAGGSGMPLVGLAPDETRLERRLAACVRTTLDGIHAPVVSAVRPGAPREVITEYARSRAIDLIVIGTHARGLAASLFHGSTSRAVLQHARCAVLMVPPSALAHEEPWPELADLVAAGRDCGAF